jgi:hypothetical protein
MRRIAVFLFIVSVCSAEFLETDSIQGNNGRLQLNDSLYIITKPLATSPHYFAVFDSASNLMKACPVDTIIPDSVTHAVYSDTADTALNTPDSVRASLKSQRSDTATIGLSLLHGVATNYFAVAKSSSLLDDSLLHYDGNTYYGHGPLLTYGTSNVSNPLFLILNNSSSANSYARLMLENLQTFYGWYQGHFAIASLKMQAGGYTGKNKFVIRSVSDPSPETFIDHIAIIDSTGQMTLNDSLFKDFYSYPYRDKWYPVWIKHGGLKIEDSTIIKDISMISMTDTVPIIRGDGLVGGISASSFRTGIGAISTAAVSDSLDIIRDTLNNRLPLHGKADSAVIADHAKDVDDTCNARINGTANYVPYFSSSHALSNSELRYNSSYSNLSYGVAPVSNIKFYGYYNPTNLANRYNGYFYTDADVTANGNYGGYALNAYCYANLASADLVDAGSYHGFWMRAYLLTSGTVGALYGLRFNYGTNGSIVGNVSGGVAGIEMNPYRQGTGTIAKNWDIVINAPVGSATVTTDWCIYSEHAAQSQFEGGLNLDSDTSKIVFGEGQDAGIYYDGSNMIFNSRTVGTGNYHLKNGKLKLWNLNIGNLPMVDTDSTLKSSSVTDTGDYFDIRENISSDSGACFAKTYFNVPVYHYANGILIKTSIDTTSNTMFELQIHGNSYWSDFPIAAAIQGYIYSNDGMFYNPGGWTNGIVDTVYMFKCRGKVYFWHTQSDDFQTYNYILSTSESTARNRILAVVDTICPTDTTKSTIVICKKMWSEYNLPTPIQGTVTDGNIPITSGDTLTDLMKADTPFTDYGFFYYNPDFGLTAKKYLTCPTGAWNIKFSGDDFQLRPDDDTYSRLVFDLYSGSRTVYAARNVTGVLRFSYTDTADARDATGVSTDTSSVEIRKDTLVCKRLMVLSDSSFSAYCSLYDGATYRARSIAYFLVKYSDSTIRITGNQILGTLSGGGAYVKCPSIKSARYTGDKALIPVQIYNNSTNVIGLIQPLAGELQLFTEGSADLAAGSGGIKPFDISYRF